MFLSKKIVKIFLNIKKIVKKPTKVLYDSCSCFYLEYTTFIVIDR